MKLILDKDDSPESLQEKIMKFHKERRLKKQAIKRQIIENTFGKVSFDDKKSAPEAYKEMNLDKDNSPESLQEKIMKFEAERRLKQQEIKRQIIENTFGKVSFDDEKSAPEIYKEMRDERDTNLQ